MLLQTGILGTKAALYMDLATIYFAMLPFLVAYSITFAVKKRYKEHYRSQIFVLILTVLMVLVFETGVRMDGGYFEFIRHSSIPATFMSVFLIVHIIIALITVVSWVALILKSFQSFKLYGPNGNFFAKHKKFAKIVFAGITVTSIMGCSVYVFLFVL